MGISIKDIARKAKVSTATVSRVINNSPLVQKDTKDRILKIIEKYDYHPNLNARSLIKGKSNLLTLVIPKEAEFFSAYYFRQILYGISDALSKNHYRLMIYQPQGYDSKQGYPPRLDGFQMDGVLIIAPLMNDKLVRAMETQNKPAVLVNARSRVLDWVDVDNVQSAFRVMEKLAGMGHRRIGFIGAMAENFNAGARFEGYRLGLEKFRMVFDPQLVKNGDYSLESGHETAKEFLGFSMPPTAIFAINDLMAMGAVQAITEAGLGVPRDVSVFGFDDADVAALSQPTLSTVRQPFFEMGKAAAEALIARVENPKSSQKCIEFPGEVILRDSASSLESLPK